MKRPPICLILAPFLAVACGSSSESGPSAAPATERAQRVYVANEDAGSVSVLDGRDNKVLRTIDLMAADGSMFMPHNIQVAPDGKSIWIAAPPMEGSASTTEEVIVLDATNDAIAARIPLGSELHVAHVVLDPQSTRAFVTANEGDALFEIDAAKKTVTRRVDLAPGTRPHGMRFCAGKLFVAAMDGKAMLAIDPSSMASTTISLGGVAVQTGCSPDGRYAFASLYDTKEVIRYEIATGGITRVSLPPEAQGPVQVYPSPDGATLYVADQGILLNRPASDRLYLVDVPSWTVRSSVKVGRAAHGVVASEDGKRVFVTNLDEGSVSVVDPAAGVVVSTVPVGAKPNGISHWHETGGMP